MENTNLKKANVDLEVRVSNMEKQRDADDQYNKRNFLRISGVQETPDESTDDIVMGICNAIDTDLTLSEIDRTHRIGEPKPNRPKDILVKFATYRARHKLYSKRTGLKEEALGYRGIFINEHLTPKRSKLLYAARNLAKDGKIVAAWSYDGNILIKVRAPGYENVGDDFEGVIPTKVKRISSIEDLAISCG